MKLGVALAACTVLGIKAWLFISPLLPEYLRLRLA